MKLWGKALFNAMNGFSDSRETGLMRMFRTEYGREYQWMKKNGVEVTDAFVKTFLADRISSHR